MYTRKNFVLVRAESIIVVQGSEVTNANNTSHFTGFNAAGSFINKSTVVMKEKARRGGRCELPFIQKVKMQYTVERLEI